MQAQHQALAEFPQGSAATWQPALAHPQLSKIPTDLRHWVLDDESLTAKLKEHAQGFRVSLLGQQPGSMFQDEIDALNLPVDDSPTATVREVLLWVDQKPWVFARSVFPEPALLDPQLSLRHLGDRPLGEHLFRQPDLQRSPIEMAIFESDTRLGRLNQNLGFAEQKLVGRRSMFSAAGQTILVAEVFLGASPLNADQLGDL